MIRNLTIIITLVLFSGCTKHSAMQTITKTNGSLTVSSPDFYISVPGTWTDRNKPSNHVIYAGSANDNGLTKHVLISRYDLTSGGDPEGARFQAFVSTFRDTEKQVTSNQANIIEIPVHARGTGLTGGHIGVHPSAGRVVFSQAFGNDETAYNVYYELEGFSSAPDINALYKEFVEWSQTAQFK